MVKVKERCLESLRPSKSHFLAWIRVLGPVSKVSNSQKQGQNEPFLNYKYVELRCTKEDAVEVIPLA